MIPWLYDYLKEVTNNDVQLLRYITSRAGMACVCSFIITLIIGPKLIRKLISLKLGQPIRTADEVNELAELHDGKAGTPTMGGVIIVSSVMISVLLFTRWSNPFVISVIFVFLGLAAVGFLDDYQKVKKNNSKGISAKTKLLLQVLVALIAGLYLFLNKETSEFITRLYVPFNKNPIIEDMGFMCVPFLFSLLLDALML